MVTVQGNGHRGPMVPATVTAAKLKKEHVSSQTQTTKGNIVPAIASTMYLVIVGYVDVPIVKFRRHLANYNQLEI